MNSSVTGLFGKLPVSLLVTTVLPPRSTADRMTRTHEKVSYLPPSKDEEYTPITAASGVEQAFELLEGPLEAGDPVPSVWREAGAVLGSGAADPGDLAEDADPTAPPDGKGRHRAPDRPSSGAAESGVRPYRMGRRAVSGARRAVAMGSVGRTAPTSGMLSGLTKSQVAR
jgi:hypothetical protein